MDGGSQAATIGGMYTLLAAVIDLNGRPHYLHSGWFLISVANLVVIAAMIGVFVLALVLPFPGNKRNG